MTNEQPVRRETVPYPYRALDINVIGFTAVSFATNLTAEITQNPAFEGVSNASATFAGILAVSSLAVHVAARRL